MLTLRPYQQKGKDDIRASFIAGIRRVMYVSPCASGKTALFGSICEDLSKKKKKALILVHRKELLDQASRLLTKLNIPHSKVIRGKIPHNIKDIVVGSVQTVIRKLNKLPKFDLIVIDECHRAPAQSYQKICAYHHNAYILGVTASPRRTDQQGFVDTFDKLILGSTVGQLIEEGYLSPYQAYGPKTQVDLSDVSIVRGDYDVGEIENIFGQSNIIGDAVQSYKTFANGKPAIVFCVSLNHAEIVAEKFRQNGYRAIRIDGSLNDEQRSSIINGLTDGKWQVVVSVDLLIEGLDVPVAVCCILLRPTKSLVIFVQAIGRVLRPVYKSNMPLDTKEQRLAAIDKMAIILDHAGVLMEHGFPDTDRNWTLEGERRGKKSKQELVPIKKCPECYAIHKPAPTCPRCNHIYIVLGKTPKTIEGELSQLTKEDLVKQKKLLRKEIGMARDESALRKIAKERGYKQGWVYYMLKIRRKQNDQRSPS